MTPLLLVALLAAPAPPSPQRPAAPPVDREAGLKLAAERIAAGQGREAARLLRDLADRYESVRALLLLARLQSSQKDFGGAQQTLDRARRIAPNSEEVLSGYAQVSLAARHPVPAILALQSLTRIYPSVPRHHYVLGVALLQAGDYPAAAEAIQRAVELEPDRPLDLIALGLARNALKRYPEAEIPLRRCLELEPDNVEALAALAEAEEGSGDAEGAEAHAQRAIARSPEHSSANLVIGLLRMKEGRYSEARDALQKAVSSDPSSSKAHYQLSLAYARLNDPAASGEQLRIYEGQIKDAEARVRELRGEHAATPEAGP